MHKMIKDQRSEFSGVLNLFTSSGDAENKVSLIFITISAIIYFIIVVV